MTMIDLVFPVAGDAIPRDHGYPLYAALSQLLPALHGASEVGIFPIRGTPAGGDTLRTSRHSALRVRVAADRLPMLLPAAGSSVEIDGHRLRLGMPRVQALVPAATLGSRLVLIKLAHARERGVTPERFLESVRRQLDAIGVAGEAAVPLISGGPRSGEPRRRVLRVKDQTHAGYALIVRGLTAEESIRLQEIGLGGRRLMGCGLFGPVWGP
jgi:CRISPR-associated protein Cas6